MKSIRDYKFTYSQIVVIGFILIIFLGSILLSQPIAARSGRGTPFIDALFTATSATCVTGLAIADTYVHWSVFGQIIILLLIQIGGLGFMTVASLFSMLLRRKIGLAERILLMESTNTVRLGGIVRLVKEVLIGTLLFETAGAVLLALRFCPQMGFWEGAYNAVFHSISAFCNSGFDLMGKFAPYSSLTSYSADALVNIVVMALIVIGGLGFIVWDDVLTKRFAFGKYHLHTKIVLSATAALILTGGILIYFTENDHLFASMSFGEKVLASAFHSITPRTAGFNTIDTAAMSQGSNLVTMLLMVIGGSPGSTAGGLKTTTVVVLILSAVSTATHAQNLHIFKRQLEENALKRAGAITVIYLFAVIVAVLIICMLQPFSLGDVVFEALSAIGTVGLSHGITPSLDTAPKLVLIFLMYGGRVGALTMAYAFMFKREHVPLERSVEKISIG